MAQACYKRSMYAASAHCSIKAQDMLVWQAEGSYLKPGYWIALDHRSERVVWSVRGTRFMVDLLTDLCSIHPVTQGHTHWGIHQAALWLVEREGERVAGLLRKHPSYSLHLTGHSLGGGIATLLAHLAHNDEHVHSLLMPPVLQGKQRGHALGVTATSFASPCVMNKSMAESCRPYVKSVLLGQDIVPRLNATSLQSLQAELKEVDWRNQLQRSVEEHRYVQGLRSALQSASSSLGPLPQQVKPDTSLSAAFESIVGKSRVPSLPESFAPLLARLDAFQAAGLSPIQSVEKMLGEASRGWWSSAGDSSESKVAQPAALPPGSSPSPQQQQQQQQQQPTELHSTSPAAASQEREPDLASWFQSATSVAARAQQGLADLVSLSDKQWLPASVRSSLLEVLSAKQEGKQAQDVKDRRADGGAVREQRAVSGGERAAGEAANRVVRQAALIAANEAGIPREAPSLGQIRSLPEQAAAIPNSITEPTQQHTVADLSPITPKHQAQDRLSALTASVSDIARAAASLDLAAVIESIKSLGAVAEVEAAIAALTRQAPSSAASDHVQPQAVFFMMYPAGQWYHIRRRRRDGLDAPTAARPQPASDASQKPARPPFMVVRAADDAPFFSRARFTRAALRDHRCRAHRVGLSNALSQYEHSL